LKSENPKCAVVLGGSSGVGRCLAQELARSGYHIIIASRDERDLRALTTDISLRFNSSCNYLTCDLADPEMDVNSFFSACCAMFHGVDALFVPAGAVDDNDDGLSEQITRTIVNINFLNVARVISAFAHLFRDQGWGHIVAFSSIAAHTPRRNNVAYSAAKAALEAYCRSLQHTFSGSKIKMQIYALGYVDSGMSFGRKLLFPVEQPVNVAKYVIKNMDGTIRFTFYPRFWRWIIFALKSLPWFIYKKLSF
jgi:decaprenylphospho-beta-D-erythro-pentofuranosid-2-ulose 2-reductase